MQLGIIGLGRMGGNIVRRLTRAGHESVVFDRNATTMKSLVGARVQDCSDLADLVKKLEKPRVVWVMLPAGEVTENTVTRLGTLLDRGDSIIDGGDTFFQEDVRRARALQKKGIHYVDCGTSGGVWGLERGYCLMIGGEKEVVNRLDPIFAALAPGAGKIDKTPHREKRDPRVERGYLYCGPAGSGHFVKMVHNGIEYGIMQAYAEGFEIMQKAGSKEMPEERRYNLDLADIAEVWRRGSVISSWLLDLVAMSLAEDPALSKYSAVVEDSGEGRWAVNTAIEEGVPADVLSAALFARFHSRDREGTANYLLSAMRHAFGGHAGPK